MFWVEHPVDLYNIESQACVWSLSCIVYVHCGKEECIWLNIPEEKPKENLEA